MDGAYKTLDYSGVAKQNKKGRFIVINVWRNISDTQTIQNNHLAVCDGRSIIAPDDYLFYNYITKDYTSESYYLNYVNNEYHEWYYFPKMSKNEILLFTQFDSNPKSLSRHIFHTAIKDPTFNSKKNKDIFRQSIECRLIACFYDFIPNTIMLHKTAKLISDNDKTDSKTFVKEMVNKIFNAISPEIAKMWPENGKDYMVKQLKLMNKNQAKIENIIENNVNNYIDGGYGGIGDATKEERKEILKIVLSRKDEYEKICRNSFQVDKSQ